MADRDVRFIRKNGRIIPIRNRKKKDTFSQNVKEGLPNAVKTGVLSGFGVHSYLTSRQLAITSAVEKGVPAIEKARDALLKYPSIPTNMAKPPSNTPGITGFIQNIYKTYKRRAFVNRGISTLKTVQKTVDKAAKFKLKASIGVGLLAGIAAGYSTAKKK